MTTSYETAKIKSHSYLLEAGKGLEVADYYYPLAGCSNFQANHLFFKLTPKRATIEDWITRDNWNGSGVETGDKDYLDNRKEVQELIEKAKKIIALPNDEDKDYEVKKFVAEIFRDYTNMMLDEEMEEMIGE